mgnify:CR=1 FL=1
MKRILYLHGLESSPGGKKVDFLSSKAYVHAPEMDYTDKNVFTDLLKSVVNFTPDIIIGSSMGGYFAYALGGVCKIPVLLFNPALHSRTFEPLIPEFVKDYYPPKMEVILGSDDAVINSNTTLQYLDNTLPPKYAGCSTSVIKDMGHRTSLPVFIDMYNKNKLTCLPKKI